MDGTWDADTQMLNPATFFMLQFLQNRLAQVSNIFGHALHASADISLAGFFIKKPAFFINNCGSYMTPA
jgi:hypothetical protein